MIVRYVDTMVWQALDASTLALGWKTFCLHFIDLNEQYSSLLDRDYGHSCRTNEERSCFKYHLRSPKALG